MSLDLAGSAPTTIDLGVLPSELDGGLASRAAIGLVVLATDQTMEHEFRALIRLPGVAFYESRLFNDAEIRPDTLRAIGPRIAPSVALVLPGLKLDVVAFGCTSATMTLGEEAVFAEIHKSRPGVACTTPVTAALAAFRAFRAGDQRFAHRFFPRPRHPCRRRGHLRPPRRPRCGAHFSGFDRSGGSAPRRGVGRRDSLRFLHQSQGRRGCGEARTSRRRSGHLQQPRDGLALPQARGNWRGHARARKAVRTGGVNPLPFTGEGWGEWERAYCGTGRAMLDTTSHLPPRFSKIWVSNTLRVIASPALVFAVA